MLTYNFVVISCTSILFCFYDLGRKTEKERRATSEGGGRPGKSIWLRNTLLAIGRVWFVFCSNAGETPPVRSWKTGKTWRDATEKARAGTWEQTGRNIREKEAKLRLIYLENSSPIAAKFYTPALSVSIGFFLFIDDRFRRPNTNERNTKERRREKKLLKKRPGLCNSALSVVDFELYLENLSLTRCTLMMQT